MMGPDPGEIEVKMQRYYKSLSQKDHSIWAAIKALKVR
jgi:glycine cleavage system protein P-like pyridoxal-binding family